MQVENKINVSQTSISIREIDVAGLDEEMAKTQQEAEHVVETVEHTAPKRGALKI